MVVERVSREFPADGASRSIVIESKSPWFGLLLLPVFAVVFVLALLAFGTVVLGLLLAAPLLRWIGRRSSRTIEVQATRVAPRPGPPDGPPAD